MPARLSKAMVEDRVEKIAEELGVDTHNAFLRLLFSLVTGQGYDELEPEDLVDGAGEYQIDVLHLDDYSAENRATVTIIQGTYSESLSSTRLIRLHAGLDYLLTKPKDQFQRLSNRALADKIQQFRDLRADILPSNIRLQVYYANLMDTDQSGGEFDEQVSRIRADYSSSTGEFVFQPLGPSQVFELIDRSERRGTKVNDRLRIVYDQSKANLLEHSIEGVSGVICTAPADDVARIVNAHPTVFDENLRRFRGLGGSVNKAISGTCTSPQESSLFWFLNNGITIVCEDFDVHKDFDNPFVAITDLHIVNGCQTSTALAKAQEDATLQPSTKLMVRVFKTASSDLASRLVITTNTQNVISARELHANDPIQYTIQAAFRDRFDVWYERTPNEFSGSPRASRRPLLPNHRIGQAHLAVVKKRPADARGRLYKIWGEDYESTFNDTVYPETYLLAYRILQGCKLRKRSVYSTFPQGDIRRSILGNGILHLARASALIWRGSDDWSDRPALQAQLAELQQDPTILNGPFDKALRKLVRVFASSEHFTRDPFLALKSNRFDDALDRVLYVRKLASARVSSRQSRSRR